jgi:hypothetical protein
MKVILTAVFTFLSSVSICQQLEIDSVSQRYQYTEVVQADSSTKDALFTKVKEWIALSYRSMDAVMQLEDKETGKMIVKGNMVTTMFMQKAWLGHTLIFDFKNGKFRYAFTDFTYKSSNGQGYTYENYPKAFLKKLLRRTEEQLQETVKGLKDYLQKKSATNDNW